jgi:heptosyltransferase II
LPTESAGWSTIQSSALLLARLAGFEPRPAFPKTGWSQKSSKPTTQFSILEARVARRSSPGCLDGIGLLRHNGGGQQAADSQHHSGDGGFCRCTLSELCSAEMQKTLILKLGALGDVLRTTALLHLLPSEVTWVTSAKAAPLLDQNPLIDRLYLIENLDLSVIRQHFDLVINLEDEMSAARLATELSATRRLGPYLAGSVITYDEFSRPWFDLSLSSRFGKEKADQLKRENLETYQDLIFSMLGKTFEGQEYILKAPDGIAAVPGLVGIEPRVGDVWPMKQWNRFDALHQELEHRSIHCKVFEQRSRLQQYIEDIQECEVVVSGDTLAMHIALALRKKVVAIFTCTSPQEIHDYGRLIKVVSPLWEKYFYWRKYVSEAAEAIPLRQVLDAVLMQIGEWPAAS